MQPRILLDTHVLVRWLSDSKKLSREQARVLNLAATRNEPIAISAMSLLEISMLVSAGKLKVSVPYLFDVIAGNPIFRLIPLDFEIAIEARYLAALVDPADRVIVAAARVRRLVLVTSDIRMIESGFCETVS